MSNHQQLAEQHGFAMAAHLQRRAAGILFYQLDPSAPPTDVGSGTFVEVGGRHFVATAGHNLLDVELRQIGVIALGDAVTRENRTPRLVGWGRRGGGKRERLDVGWLEIEPRAVPRLKEEWQRIFTTIDRLDPAPLPAGAVLALFGQPADYVKVTQLGAPGGPDIRLGALPYLSNAVATPPDLPAEDVYMGYGTVMQTAGGSKPAPVAKGLSGSGVWSVNPSAEKLWSPDHAKLVAIQSFWQEGEWLRGNGIREWIRMLREDIPELAQHLDPVLEKRD